MNTHTLERELLRRSRQVAALSQLAQELAGSLDTDRVARSGLTHALAIAEMDAGEVLLWDEDKHALVHCLHGGDAEQAFSEQEHFAPGEGIPGMVLRTGGVLVLDPVAAPDRVRRPGLIAAGFRTLISLPLRTEVRTIGVMNLAAREPRAVDLELEELLLGLGGQLGIALDRAQTYERERTLRRRLEALNQATLAIAGELSLATLLQRICDIARELTGARYAALGVADARHRLTEFFTSGISGEQREALGHLPEGHGLLGLILRGDAPVRVPNIAHHGVSYGFPPGHPPMKSFLGVPIVLRGRNLGNLYLTDKEGDTAFTADDEQVLMQLAAHAAIAVENARLYGRTSESLERRVAELHEANAQLAYLSSLAISAQEEERRRLARELHDDTAQELASLLVRLRVLERTTDPTEMRARLHEFRELIARALDGVRRMAMDLRPSALDDLGLVPALEAHIRAMTDRWGVKVRLSATGIESRLPNDIELVTYRIVQEALSNIFKHAQATEVTVGLAVGGGELRVNVRDNGRGFDVEQTLASRERGLGLFGMQERASLVGGRVDVFSAPGNGTEIKAVIPIRGARSVERGSRRKD